jgi:hypothetical protein
MGLVILLIVYLVPSIIALVTRKNRLRAILINIFLGWTVIGWIAAVVLASGGNTDWLEGSTHSDGASTSNPDKDTRAEDRYWEQRRRDQEFGEVQHYKQVEQEVQRQMEAQAKYWEDKQRSE